MFLQIRLEYEFGFNSGELLSRIKAKCHVKKNFTLFAPRASTESWPLATIRQATTAATTKQKNKYTHYVSTSTITREDSAAAISH